MIKTVIIDDEISCTKYLESLIIEKCPFLRVSAVCNSPLDGITAIIDHKPELLFLDIEMPIKNGFEVLDQVSSIPLKVIFTTAHHQHAINAIRVSALDFLLKPIDPNELVAAVSRYLDFKSKPDPAQIKFLLDKLSEKEHTNRKIAIANMDGLSLINIDDIIYCEADDNYTIFKLKQGHKIIASRTLKDIQSLLEEYPNFFRIHNSFLININEVKHYMKIDGGYVVMADNSQLSISRNKKLTFLKYLNNGKDFR